MKVSLIGFVLRRVRQSLWQLLWTHVLTSGTMAMTLFVFGAFILVAGESCKICSRAGVTRLQITAYLDKDVSAEAVQRLISAGAILS